MPDDEMDDEAWGTGGPLGLPTTLDMDAHDFAVRILTCAKIVAWKKVELPPSAVDAHLLADALSQLVRQKAPQATEIAAWSRALPKAPPGPLPPLPPADGEPVVDADRVLEGLRRRCPVWLPFWIGAQNALARHPLEFAHASALGQFFASLGRRGSRAQISGIVRRTLAGEDARVEYFDHVRETVGADGKCKAMRPSFASDPRAPAQVAVWDAMNGLSAALSLVSLDDREKHVEALAGPMAALWTCILDESSPDARHSADLVNQRLVQLVEDLKPVPLKFDRLYLSGRISILFDYGQEPESDDPTPALVERMKKTLSRSGNPRRSKSRK